MDNNSQITNGIENGNGSTQNDETLSDFRETHKDDKVRQPAGGARFIKDSTTQTRKGSWFFWKPATEEVAPGDPNNNQSGEGQLLEQQLEIQPPQTEENNRIEALPSPNNAIDPLVTGNSRREGWAEWINPVPRVNSVVSYIYSPQDAVPSQSTIPSSNQLISTINNESAVDNQPDQEITSPTTLRSKEENTSTTFASWFLPWTYFPPKTDAIIPGDRADSMYSSKDSEEIAKDAKRAIQTNSAENGNSSWAFWSNKSDTSGELAVAGTGSESHPARMASPPTTFYENQENSLKTVPQATEVKENLVLPRFDDNYRVSTLKNQARILMSSSKFLKQTFNIKPQTHLYRSKTPHAVKKVVVIGIHGYFPIKMVRTLIGHPTGTSMKFATKATDSLTQWAAENHQELDIETIALEGEGKIVERVENLINLLDNWIDMIKNCDFIYVAAHSQGVMVAIHLISELISRKMISTKRTQVGMLNMCGVCNGPIVGLDSKLIVKAYSKFENEILMELFDFQDLASYQSIKLMQSIRNLVTNNVRITFVGSINDQLTPLYSSLFTMISHPNISRGLFVDANSTEEIPEFLVKLVEYCIVVRNMGYSDCDLIYELSRFSNGSLTNGGHSKVYNENDVYLLGIRNSLETDDLIWSSKPVLKVSNKQFNAKNVNKNPFHLPWCLRGFIDELVSIKNLQGESMKKELLDSCNAWNPQSKTHKELKYCVEVICQKY